MSKPYHWTPPISTARGREEAGFSSIERAIQVYDGGGSVKESKSHLLFIVFSKAKDREPWYNRMTQWVTKSDTLHVSVMLEDGGIYSVNGKTNTVEYAQPIRLYRNFVDAEQRGHDYFCITLSSDAYRRARQILDFHVDARTSYDIRFYYSMGLISWMVGSQCIGKTCTTDNTITCSRMVYDLLRDERVGALDPSVYQQDDAILAGNLEKIIQKNTERFQAQNFADVMEHIKSHQQASTVVTTDD